MGIINGVDAYIGSLTAKEEGNVALATAAFDLASWLDPAADDGGRHGEGPLNAEALRRHAVGHFEPGGALPQLGVLAHYLSELGYVLALQLLDAESGEPVARVVLPTAAATGEPATAASATEAPAAQRGQR